MRETPGEIRLQRRVTIVCSLFFALFCYAFVAVYRSPFVEIAYDNIATGKLQYNDYVPAGVVTVVLVALSLWLNRFAKFKREWTAMAFLPSTLLLAFMADAVCSSFVEISYTKWVWAFVVGGVVYVFLSFLLGRMLFESIKNLGMATNRIMWRNFLLLALMFFIAGVLPCGDKTIRREAVQYSLFKRGDLDAALAVGERSPMTSRNLTLQRAFLLSLKGQLGERLFEYPLYTGSDALLPATKHESPIPADTIYSHIGVARRSGESAVDYLARAASLDTVGTAARDYYLTALLLDRRVVEFADRVYEFYNVGDSLPKHYKEALTLYSYIVPEREIPFENHEMMQSVIGMCATMKQGRSVIDEAALHELYGDTYWWYFLCCF